MPRFNLPTVTFNIVVTITIIDEEGMYKEQTVFSSLCRAYSHLPAMINSRRISGFIATVSIDGPNHHRHFVL